LFHAGVLLSSVNRSALSTTGSIPWVMEGSPHSPLQSTSPLQVIKLSNRVRL
jgi:hypothetical protein